MKKVVAGVLLTAGLSIGGYAVASAQSTPTTTPSNPSTTAPSGGSHQDDPNCPNMGGNGSGNGSGSGQAANTTSYSSM